MKPSKFRSYFIGLLILASIFSYTYVNTATILPMQQNEHTEEAVPFNAQEEQELTMPEVQIVKKIISAGRKLIPST